MDKMNTVDPDSILSQYRLYITIAIASIVRHVPLYTSLAVYGECLVVGGLMLVASYLSVRAICRRMHPDLTKLFGYTHPRVVEENGALYTLLTTKSLTYVWILFRNFFVAWLMMFFIGRSALYFLRAFLPESFPLNYSIEVSFLVLKVSVTCTQPPINLASGLLEAVNNKIFSFLSENLDLKRFFDTGRVPSAAEDFTFPLRIVLFIFLYWVALVIIVVLTMVIPKVVGHCLAKVLLAAEGKNSPLAANNPEFDASLMNLVFFFGIDTVVLISAVLFVGWTGGRAIAKWVVLKIWRTLSDTVRISTIRRRWLLWQFGGLYGCRITQADFIFHPELFLNHITEIVNQRSEGITISPQPENTEDFDTKQLVGGQPQAHATARDERNVDEEANDEEEGALPEAHRPNEETAREAFAMLRPVPNKSEPLRLFRVEFPTPLARPFTAVERRRGLEQSPSGDRAMALPYANEIFIDVELNQEFSAIGRRRCLHFLQIALSDPPPSQENLREGFDGAVGKGKATPPPGAPRHSSRPPTPSAAAVGLGPDTANGNGAVYFNGRTMKRSAEENTNPRRYHGLLTERDVVLLVNVARRYNSRPLWLGPLLFFTVGLGELFLLLLVVISGLLNVVPPFSGRHRLHCTAQERAWYAFPLSPLHSACVFILLIGIGTFTTWFFVRNKLTWRIISTIHERLIKLNLVSFRLKEFQRRLVLPTFRWTAPFCFLPTLLDYWVWPYVTSFHWRLALLHHYGALQFVALMVLLFVMRVTARRRYGMDEAGANDAAAAEKRRGQKGRMAALRGVGAQETRDLDEEGTEWRPSTTAGTSLPNQGNPLEPPQGKEDSRGGFHSVVSDSRSEASEDVLHDSSTSNPHPLTDEGNDPMETDDEGGQLPARTGHDMHDAFRTAMMISVWGDVTHYVSSTVSAIAHQAATAAYVEFEEASIAGIRIHSFDAVRRTAGNSVASYPDDPSSSSDRDREGREGRRIGGRRREGAAVGDDPLVLGRGRNRNHLN